MSESVAIIGGGIGGLAAAHHLVRAGVENVTVYEASDRVGGKARSQYYKTANGTEYPGEHGFRFFPHFYRHLLETLRQIPVDRGTVYDRLVGPHTAAIAYEGEGLLTIPRPIRIGPTFDFAKTTIDILATKAVSLVDATKFAGRLLQFATSCQERREQELDRIAWTKFTGAEDHEYSEGFDDVAIRASQNLSAMRAERSSAATIGAITLQLLFYFDNDEKPDALLCGPTDEMWLRDWHRHLASRGVKFVFDTPLTAFRFDRRAGRITGLRFGTDEVEADHYVCAIPLECLIAVLDAEMMDYDSSLAVLPNLAEQALGNMTGMQFFLRRPVPITNGHVHYPGTAFALTSVSQGQFWRTPPDRRKGTPELGDVLSVIISDWNTAGPGGKPASAYSEPKELAAEVWRQMKAALPLNTLDDDDVLGFHLDSNISLGPFHNRSPLLVHPVDQLRRRPSAETRIENLFLAADFVRTHTDLATMEGADEAARRATRAILSRMGVGASEWPGVHPLDEGLLFAAPKMLDKVLFELGLRHSMVEEAPPLAGALANYRVDSRRSPDPRVPRIVNRLARLAGSQMATSPEELQAWERALRGEHDGDDD